MSAPGPGSTEQTYPGQRLGMPPSGSGSVARWGPRILALLIDWVLSGLVVSVMTGRSFWSPPNGVERWYPLIVFAVEATVLTALLGGSAGQLVLRIHVRRLAGARLDLARAALRSVLICLVIPAVIYNRDQRGLHDLAADSVVVRR